MGLDGKRIKVIKNLHIIRIEDSIKPNWKFLIGNFDNNENVQVPDTEKDVGRRKGARKMKSG